MYRISGHKWASILAVRTPGYRGYVSKLGPRNPKMRNCTSSLAIHIYGPLFETHPWRSRYYYYRCCLKPLPHRCYPPGFGLRLLDLHKEVQDRPRLDLRQKKSFDPQMTDLEIFRSLTDKDPWVDAKLPSLFIYLYSNSNLRMPNEWRPAMDTFLEEMKQYVFWTH